MAPGVAVVIPSYNHATFIAEALDSVLRQSHPVDEIVVIDDGSTDDTAAVLAGYTDPRLRIRFQANRGAHQALSRGIEETTCELVMILNSDDEFTADRVARFVDLFATDPELAFAGSWIEVIDEAGRRRGIKQGWHNLEPWPMAAPAKTFQSTGDLHGNLLQANYFATTSNFVMRRAAWRRHGPFRPLRYAHDWDFALRAAAGDKIALLPQPLLRYRVHGKNTIRENEQHMRFEVLWVLAAHLGEYLARRASSGSAGGDVLRRLLRSLQTFGNERLFALLVAMERAEASGAAKAFSSLLQAGDPVRECLLREMTEWSV